MKYSNADLFAEMQLLCVNKAGHLANLTKLADAGKRPQIEAELVRDSLPKFEQIRDMLQAAAARDAGAGK